MIMQDRKWLHNEVLSLLSNTLTKPLLTIENLNPFKIEIKKMTQPDMVVEEEYNFRGWELVKNDVRYLVSDKDKHDNPVHIKDVLPLLPNMPIELGYRGNVYKHVLKPVSRKTRPVQSISFKEMISEMTGIQSNNQNHQIVLNILAFVARNTKTNFAMSSNPGFGKDFNIVRHNALSNKCATIESPTRAKLELMSPLMHLLMVNEICSMSGEAWRIVQGYLLSFGAHLEEVSRHSCGVGRAEVLQVKNLSLILAFNDITNYKKPMEKFFDYATDDAVLDRFPKFRLWGDYTEDFNLLKQGIHIPSYVQDNIDAFKELRSNYEFYGKALRERSKEVLHGYNRTSFGVHVGRDNTNMNNILDGFDMFSESQEEFNKWIDIIKLSQRDYSTMTAFPFQLESLLTKMKIPKATIEKSMNNFNACIYRKHNAKMHDGIIVSYIKGKYMKQGKWINSEWKYNYEYLSNIYNADTFIEKQRLISIFVPKKDQSIEDKGVWE